MDTDQLLAFERIVREGSFSRAAWALGVAQPTISARVQALEQAVGGSLFTRNSRGATLTDLGASFLPFARRALEVLEAGVDAARQARAGQRGKVALGTLESLSGSFLGPVVADFHAGHPQVELLVRAGRHEQLVELLRDGVISLAIIAWPCPDTITTDLEPLLRLRERVVPVVAARHILADAATVTESRLAEAARPFLLLRWWLSLPPQVARIARQASSIIDVPMDTGRQMVLSGAGAGFFPWMQVVELLQTGQLRELKLQPATTLERESALVHRAATALSPAAQSLVARITGRARQLGLAVDADQPTTQPAGGLRQA